MTDAAPFASPAPGGVRVRVKVAPKASRNGAGGLVGDGGDAALKVSVTVAPEGGKANAAVVKLLAKEWKVAKSDIQVVAGATDRRKVLLVAGDPADLMARLRRWAAPGGQ